MGQMERVERLGKEPLQPSSDLYRVFRLAFPNNDRSQARRLQIAQIATITCDVSFSLRLPELRVRLRHYPPILTGVHMPEAAMYEDCRLMLGEECIRFPGKVFAMQPEAIPEAV